MAEWFKRFFGGLYDRVLERQFNESQTADHVCAVRRVLKLRKGQRVLDVPCGMGRLTLPLARAGMQMTGVDLAPPYVRKARRLARREGLNIRVLRQDMRQIAFEAEFDAALNWFGSFGYFSDEENLAFARTLRQALKPGGRLLVEGQNKSEMLAHFRPHSDGTIAGVRIVQRAKWHEQDNRVRVDWTFSKGTVRQRGSICMRIYNGAEIRALLRAAGFRDVELHGYPPLGRFTRHSRRWLAVARRPVKERGR